MALATKPKPSGTIHKKRTGQHHRHSKHYIKTYWPYLPLLLIVGLGFLANSVWPHQGDVLGYATDMSAQRLLADTNVQRANYHEKALSLNPTLTQAAQAKAADMAARNYWSHNTPDGKTPWAFFTAAGYHYQRAGENLAYGFDTASQTLTAWMNSPEHRANILEGDYTQVGFGIINVPNYRGAGPETLVVAFYAEPVLVQTASAPITHQAAPVESSSLKQSEPASQPVARIQILTDGQAPWSVFALSIVVSAAVILFVIRHGLLWHKALVRSEAFIIHHPLLDIVVVSIGTVGVLLSQNAGFIR